MAPATPLLILILSSLSLSHQFPIKCRCERRDPPPQPDAVPFPEYFNVSCLFAEDADYTDLHNEGYSATHLGGPRVIIQYTKPPTSPNWMEGIPVLPIARVLNTIGKFSTLIPEDAHLAPFLGDCAANLGFSAISIDFLVERLVLLREPSTPDFAIGPNSFVFTMDYDLMMGEYEKIEIWKILEMIRAWELSVGETEAAESMSVSLFHVSTTGNNQLIQYYMDKEARVQICVVPGELGRMLGEIYSRQLMSQYNVNAEEILIVGKQYEEFEVLIERPGAEVLTIGWMCVYLGLAHKKYILFVMALLVLVITWILGGETRFVHRRDWWEHDWWGRGIEHWAVNVIGGAVG